MKACECPHVLRRRAGHRRVVRAFVISFGGFVAFAAILVVLLTLDVVGYELVLWLYLATVVMAMIAFFELSREIRPRLMWRELQRGDVAQVVVFPFLYFVGWLDVFGDELQGWRAALLATGITVVVCVVAYEFVLRIPPGVAAFRRKAFGELTEDSRRVVYEYRRHELFCGARDERAKARLRAKARAAAIRRRRTRGAGTWEGKFSRGFDIYVLAPYEDIALWLSMYTISAALFAVLFSRMEPGPLAVILVFLPFALMPVVAFVWGKLKGQ